MDPGTRAMQARQRRQWIVFGVLSAIAVVIGITQLIETSPSSATAAPDLGQASGGAQQAASEATALRPVEVTWPVEVRRDLFAWENVFEPVSEAEAEPEVVEPEPIETGPDPAAIRAEAAKVVRLQAIIYGEEPIAMINGEVHRAGDRVGDFVLARIGPRKIFVVKDTVEVSIELALPAER